MFIENVRNIAIGIAVMILVPSITHVGIKLIVQEPDHLSYQERQTKDPETLKKYDLENTVFKKYYFYISAIVGIITIIAGIIIPIPFLGMGFILGGVICLANAYLGYWDQLALLIKFISLLAALILLIIASFRFVKSDQQRTKD